MDRLSESQLETIRANPIEDGFDAFRNTFQTTYSNTRGYTSLAHFEQLVSDTSECCARPPEKKLTDAEWKDQALRLIPTILLLPAASALPSTMATGFLHGEILSLLVRLTSGDVEIEQITRLVNYVITQVDDIQVWTEVYNVIVRTKPVQPTTPPRPALSFPSSFKQTPWSFNTNFVDSSELRKDIDPILRNELDDSLTIDHPEFMHAFLGKVTRLDEIVDIILLNGQRMDPPLYQNGTGWLEWPKECEESDILQWLRRHMDLFLSLAKEHGLAPPTRRRYFTTPTKPIPGSVSRRKLDVGVADEDEAHAEAGLPYEHEPSRDWSRILVVGELKSNMREDSHRNTWLDLARYTREIFGAQNRRFVLGFTLCGTKMRLWEFDRLGGVASLPFDVNADGKMFIQVILGFFLMTVSNLALIPLFGQKPASNLLKLREMIGRKS